MISFVNRKTHDSGDMIINSDQKMHRIKSVIFALAIHGYHSRRSPDRSFDVLALIENDLVAEEGDGYVLLLITPCAAFCTERVQAGVRLAQDRNHLIISHPDLQLVVVRCGQFVAADEQGCKNDERYTAPCHCMDPSWNGDWARPSQK